MPIILKISGSSSVTGISPNEALHGHTTDATAITTTTSVAAAETLHGHLTDEAQVFLIFPANSLHGHTADAASVVKVISPAETLHGHLADGVTSTSVNGISPRECLHGHATDASATLGNLIPGDVFNVEIVAIGVTVKLVKPTVDVAMIPAYELVEVV